MKNLRPFHVAFPVADLQKAREFYTNTLGSNEGRSDSTWIDYDFFGHQVVFHLDRTGKSHKVENPVDGHGVPVPHFGVVLTWDDWHAFADKLRAIGTKFVIEPYIRFKGQPGEQATLFFNDPNGLSLEFKAFKDDRNLFKK